MVPATQNASCCRRRKRLNFDVIHINLDRPALKSLLIVIFRLCLSSQVCRSYKQDSSELKERGTACQ